MTEWKTVPGYEGFYEVSDDGQVKSFRRRSPALLKQFGHGGGKVYLGVDLCDGGRPKRFLVHRLVALAFISPQTGPLVRHLDDNPRRNVVANLAWGTDTENHADSVRNGSRPDNRTSGYCRKGHPFDEQNTYHSPRGRACRACHRLAVINYELRKKATS